MKLTKTVTGSFLALSLIAGCSSGDNGGNAPSASTSSDSGKNKERIPITIAAQYWSGPKWAEDHPTIKYLNEKFNVDIKLQLINGPEYNEKLKVMAASGSLPDLYRAYSDTYITWQREGAFMDLSGVLPEYKNLSKAFPMDHEAVKVLNPSGKLYGLPEISWTVRDTVQIRQDWLDNLGMKLPSADEFTVDKFYEIAKAFAKQDPDKNGKNDTVGFAANNISLRNAFGIANEWTKKDGKLIPHQLQVEEYKAYLAFMKKAYSEGVLDRDFVLRKTPEIEDLMKSNKLGLFQYHNAYNDIESAVKKTFPETKPVIVPMAPPAGPAGLRGNTNMAIGLTKQVINAKAGKEKIDRILQILDWWVTEEGTKVMKNGVEGVHYKKNAEGKYEITDKWEPDVPRHLNSNLFKRPGTDFNLYLWTSPAEIKRNEDYKALVEKYPWPNAAMGLEVYSDTYKKKSADLNAKFQEATYKIIMGEQPVESIDKASKDWVANGGEQIIKEINEAAVQK
ncbi:MULTISPECIES: extracellular solute-binding protein [unclassified Paenibacillus]|uniref:extracellular solute-binding protein n=1 Tax=unclassified Paenibacillus TaxID=185978 RepID=UPI0007006065|nr:extracellular solute-binding protein [Paenibacillus sp. Soil750]KRE69723.1 hypothetical protein ASL11_15255 [Paenibacillus sp. Soil750]